MVAHYRPFFVIRAVSVLLLGFCMRQDALAQGTEQQGDLVYRFKLVGVADPVDAKPIQYALLENPGMHMCVYIHEGEWFKLATPLSMSLSEFRALVGVAGHDLDGPVLVSNGTVMGSTLTDKR
jgi:hypothetical protein